MSVAVPQRRATWHEAYDTQMSLWRWVRTDGGQRWLRASYEMAVERDLSAYGEEVERSNREMIAKLYGAEENKLLSADPIFVSAEMCQVIDAARGTFEPEALYPMDIISTHGFVYFEEPFAARDRLDNEMFIAGFSWAPMLGNRADIETMRASGDALAWLQARDYSHIDLLPTDRPAPDDVNMDGLAVTIYTTTTDETRRLRSGETLPAVLPMHCTPWWFGMSFGGNNVDIHGQPTAAQWWWKIAQTTLRLMQQRIAVHHAMRPDRASRREAKRRGFDDREVVVVRLRRERTGENEGVGANANYSHRFIVSGHWRNQWYPSGAVHRQLWISPYVKGPDELPLIVRPRRVYTWDR